MFLRANGFSLNNANFQTICIQPLKFIRISLVHILISFLTIYTAPKLKVGKIFFMLSFP